MKAHIVAAFSAGAANYDDLAYVQRKVAERLATRIRNMMPVAPKCILEIGCGTGLLSAHLASLFPDAELLLTDISPTMLEHARNRLGMRASYRLMDGEAPNPAVGQFDLIASSLAMQWFGDLQCGIAGLKDLLLPGGKFAFATLGEETFNEWRAAHIILGLRPGLHPYPSPQDFPWPAQSGPQQLDGSIEVEIIREHHKDGMAFIRALKALGAGHPVLDYRPLNAAQLRRVLNQFSAGCTVSYQVLFGLLGSDASPARLLSQADAI